MFSLTRPCQRELGEFLDRSRHLPLSYDQVGIAKQSPPGFSVDEASAVVGKGKQVFERARIALSEWRHFELGWVELFPPGAAIEPGTAVVVLVRHLGFWSLNGCRVVYGLGDQQTGANFGFAYGALTNHTEMGEEIFEVVLEPESEGVFYRIRAVSKPRAALARIGYPVARVFPPRRFRELGPALSL